MTINLLYRTLENFDEEYLVKVGNIPEVLFLRLSGASTFLAATGREIAAMRKQDMDCPGSGAWEYELMFLNGEQASELERFVNAAAVDLERLDKAIYVDNRAYPFVAMTKEYSDDLRGIFADAIRKNMIAKPIAERTR